jgi:prepilin-type processing-associated H-X9-DG protein
VNDQIPSIPPYVAAPGPKTSGLAITSLIFGILGVTCLLPVLGAILAVVFGIVALNKIRKSNGRSKGRGQAIAGIVLGGFGLIMIPIMIAMFLRPLDSVRHGARRVNCRQNLEHIGAAISLYANEHDGKIPEKFEDLQPYVSLKVFICPETKDTNHPSYQILLAGKKWNSPESIGSIVVVDSLANHPVEHNILFWRKNSFGRNALYGDGHVEFKMEP